VSYCPQYLNIPIAKSISIRDPKIVVPTTILVVIIAASDKMVRTDFVAQMKNALDTNINLVRLVRKYVTRETTNRTPARITVRACVVIKIN
jgi:hypothetical protein